MYRNSSMAELMPNPINPSYKKFLHFTSEDKFQDFAKKKINSNGQQILTVKFVGH